MPFQSEKQRRYLWANEPEIAREWTDRYGARGGGIMRVPFQEGGLESLPFRDYFKLPPFSEGNPYTNTWIFPTGEEKLTTESSVGQGGLPASYIYNTSGGEDGEGNLNLTYTPGAVAKSTPDKENWFSNLFKSTPKVRGTLGTRLSNKPRIPLPAAIASWSMSPFNTESRNYNENFVDQLNFLESLGAPGSYIGRDQRSGHLRYGPDSVLSGQNVISGFGSNNYATQLAKKLAWFEAQDKEKRNEKKYQQTKDEITAWDNSPDNPKNKNKPTDSGPITYNFDPAIKKTGPTYGPHTPQPPGGQQGHNEGMAESSPDPVSDAGGDDEWGDMGWSRGGRIGLNYGGIASLWRR